MSTLKPRIAPTDREADVLVVEHPGEQGSRTEFAAILKGSCVVCPSVIIERKGPALLYKANNTKRKVYISQRYRDKAPATVEIITSCSTGKWKIIEDIEKYKELWKKKSASAACAALVWKDEVGVGAHKELKKVYNETDLRLFLRNIDSSKSVMGACQA